MRGVAYILLALLLTVVAVRWTILVTFFDIVRSGSTVQTISNLAFGVAIILSIWATALNYRDRL